MSSDAWAILDSGTNGRLQRLYDAAALRHCAALLAEIETAARAGLELGVRVLFRTHLEAFLLALYVHFGGPSALERVAQDTRSALEHNDRDFREFNERLTSERERATGARERIRQTNARNAEWNETHPGETPRPILDKPYTPKLSTTGVDLTEAVEDFGTLVARSRRSVLGRMREIAALGPDAGAAAPLERRSTDPVRSLFRPISRRHRNAGAGQNRGSRRPPIPQKVGTVVGSRTMTDRRTPTRSR